MNLKPLMRLDVEIAEPLVIGDVPGGYRRVIPIVGGRFYRALKLSQKLIDYEQEVISRVQQSVASL